MMDVGVRWIFKKNVKIKSIVVRIFKMIYILEYKILQKEKSITKSNLISKH